MDRGRIVADGRALEIFQDTRLDTTFGVSFERLDTPHHRLLLPTLSR
jgi:ABC-type cobalamin transport system ATPase subunit